MLKIKQCIIYIMVFVIFSGSFGPMTLAIAKPATAEIPPPISDPAQLQEATKILANTNETFQPTDEQKAAVGEEVEKAPSNPTEQETNSWMDRMAGKLANNDTVKDGLWSTFQSFVTTWTLLAVAAAHKRAHDQNLQLTPENQKKLANDLGEDWGIWKQTGYNTVGSVPSFMTSTGLTYLYKKITAPLIKNLIYRSALQRLFKYFISGAMLSIGTEYIKGIVIFAAQEVLDHPDKFGGLSLDERGALKLLQTRAGFFYFVDDLFKISYHAEGVFKEGPLQPDPKEKRRLEIFHNIDWKVASAMHIILMADNGLRWALWGHLFREAFLQGRNGQVIIASLASDIVTPFLVAKESGWWEKNSRSLGIAIGLGFLASLAPTTWKDKGTAKANTSWTYVEKGWQYAKFWKDFRLFNSSDSSVMEKKIEEYLGDEVYSRQNRFTKFAYIMKLALDRSDALILERDQTLASENAPIKLSKTFKEDFTNLYNLVMGGDFISVSTRVGWDDENLVTYEEMFRNAATGMLKIYNDDSMKYKTLFDFQLAPEPRARVEMEQRNLMQMQYFITYLSQTLDSRWTKKDPPTPYYTARHLLEQISFWGIREPDIIEVFNGGRINYQ